jgi:hypothetical protein
MSQSTTNTPYMNKSMNGIIIIDDGAGTTIENGVVTCLELDVPRINVDQIESRSVGANVSMFTELVGGSIHLGSSATTLFVDAPTTVSNVNVTNLNATNISTNNIVSANTGTAVTLFTNQTAGISLGTAIGFGAMLIGGASQTGQLTIRNTGVMNLGVNSSSINIGTSQTALRTINIGNLGTTNMSASTMNIQGANASSTANFFTNVSTGVINIGTTMFTGTNINIGMQGEINFSNSTLNIGGGANVSNLFCDNFRHELYGTNSSMMLDYFGAAIQFGNVSTPFNIYSPVNISNSLTTNTITATNSSSNTYVYQNITTGVLQLATNALLVEIGTDSTTVSIGYNSRVDIARLSINNAEIIPTDSTSILTIGGVNMSTLQTIAIGTSQENVYLGATTATSKVFVGDFKFTADTMNLMVGSIPNVSGIMRIGDALTVGDLRLAIGLTTGDLVMGNNTMTGDINVRTSGGLYLGNSASIIQLGTGTSVINSITMGNASTTAINMGTTSVGGTINVGSDSNTGGLNLKTSGICFLANLASTLNMGTNMSSGIITIGSNSMTGDLRVRTSGILSLGPSASAINIGTTASTTNTISIGNVSSSFSVNTPINPNYDTKYTLWTGTPSGCIGNVIEPDVYNSGAITSGTAKTFNTFTNLPIGVWLLYYQQVFTCPTTQCALTTSAGLQMRMGTTSTGVEIGLMYADAAQAVMNVGTTKSYLFTQIYSQTSAVNVYFNVNITFTGTLSGSTGSIAYTKAVRLA